MPQFTNPPQVPNRGDRATFSQRVDAFLRWLVTFVSQLNLFVSNLNARDAGGAATFSFTFDTANSLTDPGAGKIRLDNANQAAALTIAVDNLSDTNIDIGGYLNTIQTVTSNTKGSLRIERAKFPGSWILFDITSVNDNGGYKTLSVVSRASSSPNPFSFGDSLILYFDKNGDKGDGGNTPSSQQIRDAIGILPISNGGTGANSASVALSNLGGTSLQSVLNTYSAQDGATKVGFTPAVTNGVSTTIDAVLNQNQVNVFRFLTTAQIADVRSANPSMDLTAPIQRAIDWAYDNNVGTVRFPRGIYLVTSIGKNWAAVRSVNILGDGKRSTVFRKFDSSTTPIFAWSANDNILETYSNFEGFTIIGTNKAHHGIQVTKCARFSINDVYIGGCDRAIDNQGALVWYGQNLTLQGNNYGLYTTRSSTSSGGFIYPNLIRLESSHVCFNTAYGVYGEYANGFSSENVDYESNGTAGDQSTGAVIFKQTHVEAGVGSVWINGGWFEQNKGWAFTMDSANNLTSLSITNVPFIANESGRACRVLNARSVSLQSVMAVTPGDTFAIAADHSYITSCTISTITDTSTRSTWTNVITSNDPVGEGGFSNGLNISNGKPLTLSWARGAGKSTITPDTNGGHVDYNTPSGLHRFNNQIGIFAAVPQSSAKAQALFVDSSDNKLKFKDINGAINLLY